MTIKIRFRMFIDILMLIFLILLMAYELIGEGIHEWIGILMFLLFICHHLVNWHWLRFLLKGKYNQIRKIGTLLDMVLFILIILLLISGMLMSKYVFIFPNSKDFIGSARIIHLLASYWGFVLVSIHIGFHWNRISRLVKIPIHLVVFKILSFIICCYGIHAFIFRQLGTYMLLMSEFVFFDFDEAIFYFLFDYITILFMFGSFGNLIFNVLKVKSGHLPKIFKEWCYVVKLKMNNLE